ncbi:hypothetical protein DFH09DRAFT_1373931 [Mycena vulgaris]|nr:hypothetical protein DFH09DRAFT_1373931 [Mycena vulgaris]
MSSEIPPNIGERTAPELFGMLFNFGLMGSLLVQYYGSFPKDRKITKAIVYSVFVLELAQTGIMSYFAYTIFGAGYGDLSVFDKSELEWFPVCILGSLIAGIVQLYYAYRLHLFSNSKITTGIVTVLAVLQIGSGIGQGIISKLVTDRSNLSGKPICVTTWLLSSALCDLVIAASMSFYLKQAIVAVIQLVIFLALPKNNFFETPSWTLGKLYSNNLLVLLNTRAVVIGGRNHLESSDGFGNEINLDSRGGIAATPLTESHTSSIRFQTNLTTRGTVETQLDKDMKGYASSRTLRESDSV